MLLAIGGCFAACAGTFVPVTNAGFDALENGVAKGWSKAGPAFRVESGAGLNGSGGLVYESAKAQHAPRPGQDLALKPGKKYRISAKAIADGLTVDRADSPAQGMTVMLSWFDAAGKWLGETVAAPAAKGTMKEWCTPAAITPDMPANATRFRLEAYVCGYGVGKARLDNVTVETVDLEPVELVTSSAYRNEATGGKVRFAAAINWSDACPESEQRATFAYLGADGKRREVPAEKTPCGVRADLDVATFAFGTNDVTCTVTARGKTLGRRALAFAHLKELPARRAYIDAKGRLIVAGKPFFPLGMYTGSMTDEKIAHYARSPFNCVGPYGTWSKARLDQYEALGIKVIYSLCYAPNREASYVPNLRKNVREFAAAHPAVIGWYICDEPTLGDLPNIVRWRHEIEAMDGGNHPIWGVICSYGDTRHVLDAFDVIGIDPYPVPSSVSGVAKALRTTTAGTFGTKPMWNVPQAFAWGWLGRRENKGWRAPNKQEIANMTWQTIAGGANGIVYYSYSQLKDTYEDRDDHAAAYWAKICAAAAEVRAYERVLLADGEAPAAKADTENVLVRTYRDGDGRTYVLTVNTDEQARQAHVTLAGADRRAARTVETWDFGPAPKLTGNTLTYDLPPLGYSMIRLGK